MFLTPDQVPFFGGTYFPREPRYGLPAFADLLGRVEGLPQRLLLLQRGVSLLVRDRLVVGILLGLHLLEHVGDGLEDRERHAAERHRAGLIAAAGIVVSFLYTGSAMATTCAGVFPCPKITSG